MMSVSNSIVTILFSLQTLYMCLTLTIGQYIYAYYLKIYSIVSNGTEIVSSNQTDQCVTNENSSDANAQLWTQERSANLFFWINLMNGVPLIFMTYLLGLYISKLGHRFVALLSMIGAAMQVIIWLAIIYFDLREFWWYIAAIVIGLSGSSSILTLILNLILTENTLESERSSRFVRVNALQTALSAITTFAAGYYIEWRGFKDLYWMTLLTQILSIIIVLLYFKSYDSNDVEERRLLISTESDELEMILSNNCHRFWKVCTVFRWNRRSKKNNISLYLTVLANIFTMLATACFAPFLWLLLSAPFCWTSADVGNFSALGAISSAILSLLAMQIFTYMGADDAIICAISQLFFAGTCLCAAFAQHTWQLYVGLFLNALSGYQGSLTTSMISKWLQVNERDHAFTFVTLINTIMTAFGNSFFNWLYSKTVSNHRNLTLLLAAGLSIVPLVLNIFLFVITRKMSDDEALPFLPTDIESTSLCLPSNTLPHAGMTNCMVISRQPLIPVIRTAISQRFPYQSATDEEIEEAIHDAITDQPL